MEDDLLHFVKNVFMVDNKNEDEVTIEIELKELIEQNNKTIILLDYDGQPIKEIIFKRRNND